MTKILEICCYTAESAVNAEDAGANRIELCDNYSEGGTTPSYASIKYVVDTLHIPVNVILRPRGGDFLYSDVEFEIIRQDAIKMKELGVNGLVFGFLKATGEIDIDRTKEIIDLVHPLEYTFHRAFDMCNNYLTALEQLRKLGIDRILTSGGRDTAYDGAKAISEFIKASEDEIIVMPGSGIHEGNLMKIMETTGAKEFHSSAKVFESSGMKYYNQNIKMGKNDIDEFKKISVNKESIVNMLKILSK